MRNYENELNEIFTEKVMEFLNEGYLFLNNDSSMGYFQRVDLYKDEVQLRIIIEENDTYEGKKETFAPIIAYDLKVVKMKKNQTFIKDEDDEILSKRFFVYKKQLISENENELWEFYNLSINRIKNRKACKKREFYPNKRINNIKGFKCFKKGEVKIVRINGDYSYSNLYEIYNPKNNKVKKVYFKNKR